MKWGHIMKCKDRLPKVRAYGKIEFWFDHHLRRNAILVECDDPNFPVIVVFRYETAIERVAVEARAARLVERIRAGKVDYRVMSQRVPKDFRWERSYQGNRG